MEAMKGVLYKKINVVKNVEELMKFEPHEIYLS